MRIYAPIIVSALTVSTAASTSFVDSLTEIPNSDAYHTKPVRVVHARVQSDMPLWNETTAAFGSKYYSTAEGQFRGALDTVNTASVEGALMYVQAEGINYNTRNATQCTRKNGMKYVVFYDIVFAQTNETVAKYESEYGPMLPMDGGQCTPLSGTANFSKECMSLNGNSTVAEIGPFIGGESKETDPRAPYPNCWWYSLPNSCPLEKWGNNKTETCRASTRQGLCDMNKLPDGITCTYNYRILGYVPIDDVVGITNMTNTATGAKYSNFTEFCQAGGVEFNATEAGVWNQSIPFWKNPQNATANAARAGKLLSAYANLLNTSASSQITAAVVGHMQQLPTVAELTAANPPCYLNIKECAEAQYGCKRELYGQLCTKCNAAGAGCIARPSNFTFPILEVAVVATTTPEETGNTSTSTPASTPAPTPTSATTTTSGASTMTMAVSAAVASIALSFLMG